MASPSNLYDSTASPAECARLSDVIVQTDLQGRQKPRPKGNFFKRHCQALCACLTPKRLVRSPIFMQLPLQVSEVHGRNTLVLDLDETLVHSSFVPVSHYDFVIPVIIEDTTNYAYVAKRPGVDAFIAKAVEAFEVVIYTASLKAYANPLIDRLIDDDSKVLRLFRSSCRFMNGAYVKDLSRLGRDLRRVVIIDVRDIQNSPLSYSLQPENAIGISTWFCDPKDKDLEAIWNILEQLVDSTDIPKALSLGRRDLDFTGYSSRPIKEIGSTNRGGFNSPAHRDTLNLNCATV